MKKSLLVLLASFIATGCTSYNAYQPTAPLVGSVEAPLQAEIEVGKAIAGEATVGLLFGVIQVQGDSKFADGVTYGGGGGPINLFDPVNSAKAAAAYKAVSSSGADMIVAPRYVIDTVNYGVFKQVKVKVEGWRGKLRRIK